MKRKITMLILSVVLAVCAVGSFAGCNEDAKGFTFVEAGNGAGYYVSDVENKENLTELVIPSEYKGKSVIGINDEAFMEMNNLKKVQIPARVIKISKNAFNSCAQLEEVIFAEDSVLEEIGNDAFRGCTNLKTITIPSGVKKIGSNAFSGCESLESVVLPKGLLILGAKAFFECTMLEEIEIPAGLTSIKSETFRGCLSLISVTFAENSLLTVVDKNAFRECESLVEIFFPASVKELRYGGLYQCKSLIRVQFGNYEEGIPGQLESIGRWGISECDSLAEVYLPGTLKKIEQSAFSQDPSLSLFVFYGTKSDWDSVEKADGWNGTKPFTINSLDGEIK